MSWSSVLLLAVFTGFVLVSQTDLSLPGGDPGGASQLAADDNIVSDVHNLVQGVGFDVLIVSQKWGLVPSFCVGFSSEIDETFSSTSDLSMAFEQAKTRLDERYSWFDIWGRTQFVILSTLYYIGWSTTWLFSYFGMSLSAVEFYVLPLPSLYLTMIPKQEPFEYNQNEPSVLYIYLEQLGYDVVKVAESIGVTGPELTVVFRTSEKPEVMRQWAWAKIDTFMENYEDKWSVTYITMSAFFYLLRQADESIKYFGNEPDVDLDYVAISVGLLPFILNRFSMEGFDPAMFARDPCQ